MTTYLLIGIVCLLINRKLGIFVLVAPVVGFLLLLLFAWLADNDTVRRAFAPVPPTAGHRVETYAECVERWTPDLCSNHAPTMLGFTLLGGGLVWAFLDRRRLISFIRRTMARYRERSRQQRSVP